VETLRYTTERVLAFIEQGGDVQWAILLTTCVMWVLIVERCLYSLLPHRRRRQAALDAWFARSDRSSWYARQVRSMIISQLYHGLYAGIPMARTLVAICPLLGLLGTVVGMIHVFDVMNLSGNGNPRALAAGVSQATITTMAGMVAALSGVFITTQLERHASNERRRLEDALSTA